MGPPLSDGRRPYVRVTPEGAHGGLMSDTPTPTSTTCIELQPLGGDCFEVAKETRLTGSGPAQVATGAYRSGWDRIFGTKAEVGQA